MQQDGATKAVPGTKFSAWHRLEQKKGRPVRGGLPISVVRQPIRLEVDQATDADVVEVFVANY